VRDLTKRVKTGDWVLIDGYDGLVIVNPSEQTLFRYGKIQSQKKSFEQRLLEANRQPAVTLDGVKVTLQANIEKVDEVGLVKEYFAQGVGLFRTEYLYLNSARIPTEQEQDCRLQGGRRRARAEPGGDPDARPWRGQADDR